MNNYDYTYEVENSKSYSIVGVFAYMFLGLLITAGVSFGLYYLLLQGVVSPNVYLPMMVISLIATFVLVIFSQLVLLRGKSKGGLVTYILFAVTMGILLSSVFILYDISTIGYTFLCTAGSFGAMALYGLITKRQTASLGMFGVGLLFGVLTLTLVNIIIRSEMIYWIITYVGLAAMLALTAWDVNRAKSFSDNGMLTGNLAIYMALELYTDFIYIFIRLLAIIGRNRK